jgi:hypothetical protein
MPELVLEGTFLEPCAAHFETAAAHMLGHPRCYAGRVCVTEPELSNAMPSRDIAFSEEAGLDSGDYEPAKGPLGEGGPWQGTRDGRE